MADRISAIDYSKDRREHLSGRLWEAEVFAMATNPPENTEHTDYSQMTRVRENWSDFMIDRIIGNPSPSEGWAYSHI